MGGEGAGLHYDREHGRDVIGVATGMEYRNAHGYGRPVPDPGWAQNEVHRIREVATPHAWMLLSHYTAAEAADLLAAVDAVGGSVVDSIARRGAVLYRLCLPFPRGAHGAAGPSAIQPDGASASGTGACQDDSTDP